MRLLISAAALLVLTACGGGDDSKPAAPVTVTETVEVPTPTSDPTVAQEPEADDDAAFEPNIGERALEVGQARVGRDVTTTLLEVRDPYPPGEFRQPDAGNRFIGLRVSQCVREGADTSEGDYVSTYNGEWIAVTSDNDEYPPTGSQWVDWPTPKFPETVTMQPGGCVKGWVSTQVPEDVRWSKFVWRSDGSTVAEWLRQ